MDLFRRRKRTPVTDMTSGNIVKQLVYFAIPLLLGNLLQQFYVAIDSIVAGNFVSEDALAAVGSSGPLVNVIVSFAMGLFAGAGVVVARYYGARDAKNLRKAIHTTLILALVLGVILTFIGMAAAQTLLQVMRTPPDILPESTQFLQVYLSGLAGLCVYNAGASILNALGNSRLPLLFLIVSCFINVIGDLIFVLVFHWGVGGVAASTVIAEVVTSVMVLWALHRDKERRLLVFKEVRFDFDMFKQIVNLGLPSAVQGTIVGFSNMLVQSYFNGLGTISVAAYSASQRIDVFAQLPVQTMALAVATFVSQNLGAGQVKRARAGIRVSVIIGIAVTVFISVLNMLWGKQLLRIFTSDPAVLADGVMFLYIFSPFRFVLSGTQILPGALRGAGKPRFPTYASIFCFVVLRQIYLHIIAAWNYNLITVALCYPIPQTIAAGIILIYYLRSNWSAKFEKPEDLPQQA